MPGIFGAFAEVTALDQVEAFARSVAADPKIERGDGWIAGGYARQQQNMVRTVDRDLVGCDGEPVSGRRLAVLDSKGCSGSLASQLRANVFVLDAARNAFEIQCHEAGFLPLYWVETDDLFAFSSSLRLFRELGFNTLDRPSAACFLRHGFVIGSDSLLADVKRVRPGQLIRFERSRRRLELRDESRLWICDEVSEPTPAGPQIVEEAWHRIRRAVETSFAGAQRPAIMLSGGWDSRTLLAAALDLGIRPVGYVHGDLESREISLVRQYSKRVGIDVVAARIDDRCVDVQWLENRARVSENIVFPHWHRVGENLADRGVDCVASGVFGELLGGHYGPSMVHTGWEKIRAVAVALFGAGGADSGRDDGNLVSEVVDILPSVSERRPYFLAPDWWGDGFDIRKRNLDKTLDILNAYMSRGVSSRTALTEAFVSEHRGAQYISAQPGSYRGDVNSSQPFAESELLRFATSLPLQVRIHNSLNRSILRHSQSPLVEFPMAATLVRARRPIVLQEGSRLLRRAMESSVEQANRILKGCSKPPRLSWVNFEFMRNTDLTERLVDSLVLDIWDRPAIREKAGLLSAGGRWPRPHGFFDQLMKIYTVDSLLGRSIEVKDDYV